MADEENIIEHAEENGDESRVEGEEVVEGDDSNVGELSESVVEGELSESVVEGEEGGEEEEEDPEIAEMKRKVKEMQEEAERIEKMHRQAEEVAGTPVSSATSDARSIYVGNVDYGATAEELQAHFQGCGTMERVTIMTDKFTGHPKGFAYMEFTEEESVQNALALNESLFRGRQLKVNAKRTNQPAFMRGGRPRRASYRGYGGYMPVRRPRRFYHPYA
uniref:RRM domain-containing protein n=1 Tax=Paramoeba aestuarina TaxID=180227 RepID=A0A7S4NJG0_9EUKA|eukprot:CAMPEP_0201512386 /NCGR_PEP_ID=MMETSP0161_2-20130828/4648_1 /ASSEMBLY_ACC=CAM_ASM_000251 /TAXON_ID=180227 /ORGANISM="Neoparamoeba aestuarina, Strain SoJaBio B1-5/56/2" /LENGTH=218 /DNA_ID=CAMNT_0047908221 /DNA_START=103 /DNA_END=759 /DNA_ORIENTATION=-